MREKFLFLCHFNRLARRTCKMKKIPFAGPAKVSPSFAHPVSSRETFATSTKREAGGGGRRTAQRSL
jgi:hypothetical protein